MLRDAKDGALEPWLVRLLTGGTPAVLDKKVRLLSVEISTVTNSENTVVDGPTIAALVVRNDTTFVKLKDKLTRFNGNTNGLHGYGGNQSLFVTRGDIDESLNDRAGNIRAVSHAHRVALGKVRVVSFRTKTARFFIEFESVLLQCKRQCLGSLAQDNQVMTAN